MEVTPITTAQTKYTDCVNSNTKYNLNYKSCILKFV